jgi:hypothetical protein
MSVTYARLSDPDPWLYDSRVDNNGSRRQDSLETGLNLGSICQGGAHWWNRTCASEVFKATAPTFHSRGLLRLSVSL